MAEPHSQGDDPPGHHHHHHCHFPTSRAESLTDQKSLQYIRVPIFSGDQSLEKEQRARIAETQGEILRSAWAVLLYKYTGSEVVSFAAFCSPGLSDERKSTSTEGDRSCAENGSERFNCFILQYQVSESVRLRDACRFSREPWTADDLSRGRQVNTATDFSGRLNFLSSGKRDEEGVKEMDPVAQLRTHDWGIKNYVRRFLSLYHVVLIKPIEDEIPFVVNASTCVCVLFVARFFFITASHASRFLGLAC